MCVCEFDRKQSLNGTNTAEVVQMRRQTGEEEEEESKQSKWLRCKRNYETKQIQAGCR